MASKDDDNDDLLRVIVATDNHLGYLENDPVRGSDSFNAFEEVLKLGVEKEVDLILLGGDLFHHNKPSRQTMHRTIAMLRKYCLGEGAVRFQIVSDQALNFKANGGRVNFEDPNFAVQMPIFTIHGNHDDPTRAGGAGSLSAVDLVAACNLINYFGKADTVDNVEIAPVLIKKGDTKVALYGLGNVRDERLNRAWTQKNVKFVTPEDGTEDWFNIFTLHQNRDYGRGKKNCIHEHMLPEFLDLVIWGHEHECIIKPQWSTNEEFAILQPGSSVATSLSDGEEVPKHVGLLQIKGERFKVDPIKLKTVRPFLLKEVALIDHLDPMSSDLHEEIEKFLSETVQEMLHKHEEEMEDEEDEKRKNMLPLVRLKVDHTDFNRLAVQTQRFGAQFLGKLANPSSVLIFRRKLAASVGKGKKKKQSDDGSGLNSTDVPTTLNNAAVEDLIVKVLAQSENKLKILPEPSMNLALEHFVVKHENSAIGDQVETELRKIRAMLKKEKSLAKKEEIIARVSGHTEEQRARSEISQKRKRKTGDDSDSDDDSDDDDDDVVTKVVAESEEEEEEEKKSKRSKKKTNTKKRQTKRRNNVRESSSEEEEHDDENDLVVDLTETKTKTKTSTINGKSRKRRRVEAMNRNSSITSYFNASNEKEKDESLIVKDTKTKKKNTVSKRRRRRGAKLADPDEEMSASKRMRNILEGRDNDAEHAQDEYVDDFASALSNASALTSTKKLMMTGGSTTKKGRSRRRRR